MIQPHTLPNIRDGKRTFMRHVIQLDKYCPISHNPLPGSTLTISYIARSNVLDVIPLIIYVGGYGGGLHDDKGEIIVRDMEGMIQRIADDCANVLEVLVRARADLLLRPGNQKMNVLCWGRNQ